jgi:S-adenosylmethionine:tRNA ribosyltransferase-isomerase
MNLSDFYYDLPKNLIANYPLAKRSASRLFKVTPDKFQHLQFTDILELLKPNDLLVFNDTKVIPARLFGHKATGGKIEIMLERIINQHEMLARVRSSKSSQPGSHLLIENYALEVLYRQDEFFGLTSRGLFSIMDMLNKYGHMPLPPYIDRQDELFDRERYQTVYAKHEGAVAAPTAGLHFDAELLQQIKNKGVRCEYVTLHVGSGTFQPVRVENIQQHKMHKEFIQVTDELCDAVTETKRQGGKVIAVGTTSMRCLETAAISGTIKPFNGDTDIFIYPGFEFKCVDALVTNFHLPESTLLMLVCAFAGYKTVMNAYAEAVTQEYRFFSYGDAMFLDGTRSMLPRCPHNA